jgi:hypothetical protein
MKYNIAYIDEEDTWLQTFYQTFKSDFNIKKIKIDSDSTIAGILDAVSNKDIDGVVTDYLLDETGFSNFNGDKIVEAIKRDRPHFPVIMLTAYEPQAIDQMEDVNIINGKDDLNGESEEKVEILRSKIKSNIERYYTRISKTGSRIEELVTKRNKSSLLPEEEEELTKLFILLDELEPENKDLPANLVTSKAVTAISDFVMETKKVLEELKKSNK